MIIIKIIIIILILRGNLKNADNHLENEEKQNHEREFRNSPVWPQKFNHDFELEVNSVKEETNKKMLDMFSAEEIEYLKQILADKRTY